MFEFVSYPAKAKTMLSKYTNFSGSWPPLYKLLRVKHNPSQEAIDEVLAYLAPLTSALEAKAREKNDPERMEKMLEMVRQYFTNIPEHFCVKPWDDWDK